MFWLENLKGREHPEDLSVGGTIILECILGKQDGNMITGCIWFRILTGGGLM
jgi:hypothetical protein